LVGETPVDHLAAETQPTPGPATTTLASTPISPAPPRVPSSRPPLTRVAPPPAAPTTAPLALPFVGRSGKLLDRMLAAIGLDRTSAYIANIIPWRPPGNRTPTPQESQICLPFIRRQIELANPDVLVCMGGPSSQALLGFTDGIRRTRGRWMAFNTGTREIRAIATFHPAYLLRSPLEKRHAWRDFLAIKQALARNA
jgi:uracil-DNA glycosylase family 4